MRRRLRMCAVLLACASFAACAGNGDDDGDGVPSTTTETVDTGATTTTEPPDVCEQEPLESTDIGISSDEITVFVMADVESPRVHGELQASIDAVKAWADAVNEQGGLACRDVVVRDWDSLMSPDDTAEGIAEACEKSFAMIGTASLLVLDATALATCPDKRGRATGLPDLAVFATELPHQCNPTTFAITMAKADCPYAGGPRTSTQFTGAYRYFAERVPGLHGIHLIPGDLPSTVRSTVVDVRASEVTGIVNDGTFSVSARDEPSTFARYAQAILDHGSTYVDNLASDLAMVNLRKEAETLGVTTVDVWSCGLTCYTREFLDAGGDAIEGTYVTLPFLPFDEADQSTELATYLDAVGGIDNASPWGALSWAAAMQFGAVVEDITERLGPNAVTRARVLAGLESIETFDAGGWFGAKTQRSLSPCFVLLQVRNGEFVRIFPTQRGTFSCEPTYLVDVQIDPQDELVPG